MPPAGSRQRLPAHQAKERILDVALTQFREGGIDNVRVQHIAAVLGITDASVHYHFGNRQGLLEALLRRAGRELKQRVLEISEQDDLERGGLAEFVAVLRRLFAEEGYAELAHELWRAGWRSRQAGLLEPLVDALARRRSAGGADWRGPDQRAKRPGSAPDPEARRDARHVVALLHSVMITDALFGGEILRSVGLRDSDANRRDFQDWLVRLVERPR